jgi:hypothetical protein
LKEVSDEKAEGDMDAFGVVSVSLPFMVLADNNEGSTLVLDCWSELLAV